MSQLLELHAPGIAGESGGLQTDEMAGYLTAGPRPGPEGRWAHPAPL
jgi:hypothetical protein